MNEQVTNFIITPSWEMNKNLKLSTKYNMVQYIINVFVRHLLPSPTQRIRNNYKKIQANATYEVFDYNFIMSFV
jgi:hypothetical protein